MYLVDCFIPAIAHALDTMEQVQAGKDVDYDQFRGQVLRLLRDHAGGRQTGPDGDPDYRDALFAVAAFLDELIMNSDWSHKPRWSGELLQRHFFNTTRAGVEFFQRLDRLNPYNPVERDVREVYFYCLALGFAGQYYRPGDKARLVEILEANAEILSASLNTRYLLEEPGESGEPADEGQSEAPAFRQPVSRLPLYLGVPLLSLIGLFVYYRQGVLNAVSELLMTL